MNTKIIFHETGKDSLFKTWHASNDAMIIFIHSGDGSIVCSEKSYPIKKGVLCFVGAGKYHYTMPDTLQLYDRSKLFVSPDCINNMMKLLSNSQKLHTFSDDSFIYAQIDECNYIHVETIFEELKKQEADTSHFEFILYSCCLKLLFYLDKYSLETTATASGSINQAIEYINSNIFNHITIDEICSFIHMSKYHFCRQFKKATGLTVMNYILNTKIVLAKNILTKESFSIAEVSERCGFSSVSYFSKAFKNHTGKTPLEYRKNR